MEVECDQIDANVERLVRPMLTDPSDFDLEGKAPGSVDCWAQKAIRNSTVLFLGDSGSLFYNPNGKTKYTVDEYLNGFVDGKWTAVKSRWDNLNAVSTCGADWTSWIKGLRSVLDRVTSEQSLEKDPDGVERVPSWFHVVCFDNPNSLEADSVEGEDKRLFNNKPKARTTYEGFFANAWLQQEINDLMELLGRFKSCVYVRTAPASRWNMPEEVDLITNDSWQRATRNKVTCIRAEWLWNSINKFSTPRSNQWHHAHEEPYHRFLHYHWDRKVFRVISFSKACTIHPGTLESICDIKAYDQLYEEIKREEILRNPPQQGGSSSSGINRDGNAPADAKVEAVVPDILPTSPTYSGSLKASPGAEGTQKKRWVDIASEQRRIATMMNFLNLKVLPTPGMRL